MILFVQADNESIVFVAVGIWVRAKMVNWHNNLTKKKKLNKLPFAGSNKFQYKFYFKYLKKWDYPFGYKKYGSNKGDAGNLKYTEHVSFYNCWWAAFNRRMLLLH